MSVRDTTGVGGLARILRRLADGTAEAVAELARGEGLSRSSAFALAKRLEAAQFVARNASGKLISGHHAFALAYARFGVARLHGPAEATLRWLRDHGAATAKLTCECDGDRLTLLSFSADGRKPAGVTFRHAICDERGGEAARLEVGCRQNCANAELAEIEKLAIRAKATLERHLSGDEPVLARESEPTDGMAPRTGACPEANQERRGPPLGPRAAGRSPRVKAGRASPTPGRGA